MYLHKKNAETREKGRKERKQGSCNGGDWEDWDEKEKAAETHQKQNVTKLSSAHITPATFIFTKEADGWSQTSVNLMLDQDITDK